MPVLMFSVFARHRRPLAALLLLFCLSPSALAQRVSAKDRAAADALVQRMSAAEQRYRDAVVLAANGDTSVGSTALMIDKVTAVSMDNGSLQLQLSRGGMTTQAGIKAIL